MMYDKSKEIHIYKSPSADSRTAKGPVDVDTLLASTKMHQNDVRKAMNWFAQKLIDRAEFHDHTKVEHIEDFCNALNSGGIKETAWYKMHTTEERHHLKSNVPDDVNLFDVIEHICDCTMAGMARSGEVYDTDISKDVLQLALSNTVDLIKQVTEVTDYSDDIMDTEVQ